jgi:hypothetical protein
MSSLSIATRGYLEESAAAIATRGYLEVEIIVEVPAPTGGGTGGRMRRRVTRRVYAPIPETTDELMKQILREDEELIEIIAIAMRVIE